MKIFVVGDVVKEIGCAYNDVVAEVDYIHKTLRTETQHYFKSWQYFMLIESEDKMKVRCIKRGGWFEITEGKEYEVVTDAGSDYIIINNYGSEIAYQKSLFEVVEDKMKIKSWEELDGKENDKYGIKMSGETVFIYSNFTKCLINCFALYNYTQEGILKILEALGFDIGFISPRKLSETDYHLVRAFGDGWFARDRCGLAWYERKPIKNIEEWDYDKSHKIHFLPDNCLPFIQFSDTEPYSTAQLKSYEMEVSE